MIDVYQSTIGNNARLMTFDEARENAMLYMNPNSVKPVFVEYRNKYEDEEELRQGRLGAVVRRVAR